MIDENSFNQAFDEVVNNNDKIIVLYSGIWTFINNLNLALKNSLIGGPIFSVISFMIGIRSSAHPFSNRNPFVLIGGINVIESEEMALDAAKIYSQICNKYKIPLVFKASFDKANRSSINSFRGKSAIGENMRMTPH